MPDETLHDVMVRVGLVRPRPRPLPQSMRPAWETTPEATQYLRMPRETLNDPNTLPYVRQRLPEDLQRDREFFHLSDRQSLGGWSGHADGREGREFVQGMVEATGIPSWARGIEDLRYNNPGDALPEIAMGGLQTGSLIALPFDAAMAARGPRVPIGYRPPRLPPVQELPIPPTTRRVWHVSPHEFQPEPEFPNGRFRTDLGGSGESSGGGVGALAYGPGGYFTESPGVRDFYYDQFMRTHGRANVYEAEIPYEGYMDFDTPFGQQPSNVREGLREIYGEGPIAPDADSRVLNYREAAAMRARGINGTVFRGGIQDADPNLRNYAVFDGSDIQLGRRIPPEELGLGIRPGGLPRLPNAPARLPGRATDGSVLPIRPPEPIRQSMVGGSDDLAEAASMRPQQAPDAGQSYREQLRAEGFDVDRPMYHGTNAAIEGDLRPSQTGTYGPGVYVADAADYASEWAMHAGRNTGGANVAPVYVRGRLANGAELREAQEALGGPNGLTQEAVQAELKRRGFTGVLDNGRAVVFDPANVRSRFGVTNAPDGGASGAGQRLIVPRRSELDRIVADTRRAHPEANVEDVSAIRWVRDAQGNYHFASAMDADHQALLTRLERQGVEVPAQTKENRHLRGHFFRDENGQWHSTDMNGQDGPLPTSSAPNAGSGASAPSTGTPPKSYKALPRRTPPRPRPPQRPMR